MIKVDHPMELYTKPSKLNYFWAQEINNCLGLFLASTRFQVPCMSSPLSLSFSCFFVLSHEQKTKFESLKLLDAAQA